MRRNASTVVVLVGPAGGEVLAAVGSSGGNPESGLYFELRHQGLATDPLKWISLK